MSLSGSNSEKILEVVSRVPGSSLQSDLPDNARRVFDVIVCGGTLGVFVATALSSKGLHVGIVERNILKGVSLYGNYRVIHMITSIFDVL